MSPIPTPEHIRQVLTERLSVVGQVGGTNLAECRRLLESLADGEWRSHGNSVESLHHYDQARLVRFTFVHLLFDELKHQAAVIEEAIEQLVETILNIVPEGSTIDLHLEHRMDVRNDEARDTPIVCHGYGIVRQLA